MLNNVFKNDLRSTQPWPIFLMIAHEKKSPYFKFKFSSTDFRSKHKGLQSIVTIHDYDRKDEGNKRGQIINNVSY